MKLCLAALAVLLSSTLVPAQTPAPGGGPLTRHYRDGETLSYHMTATNEDWHYTADASSTATKTANGSYVEEFRWTAMTSNGQPVTLSPATAQFRQTLSLDPSWMPSGPDMSTADPKMVGPILDLMTFYVDLWIINKVSILKHAGDHFYVPNPQVSSWADGTHVLVGADHIDFDLNIRSIDQAQQTALVVIHHVPPAHPKLQLPADWMQAPVADTANNWVEVTKTADGKYKAAVGKETFDVTITVSTADGRILSAVMDNPVVTSGRDCDDAALTKCGVAQPHTIHRHIEIALAH
ncbi:MAG TPA: hypothetical protein VN893_04565 [Bryobacteraceae bacterium]|nr:hypothetical protein [Bryobacteraceae bacterium]